jgi:hypothetical protein
MLSIDAMHKHELKHGTGLIQKDASNSPRCKNAVYDGLVRIQACREKQAAASELYTCICGLKILDTLQKRAMTKTVVPPQSMFRSRRGFEGLYLVSLALVLSHSISNLLALARLALPVGCGVSFLAACTPNLIGGAGPVFCGTSGCAVGIDGIGGMGGIGGGLCPNPVGWG